MAGRLPWRGAGERRRRSGGSFPSVGRGLRVGLAWAGNPRYKGDRLRSVSLETLLPLLRMAGFTWISLQKGEAAEQLAGLPEDVFVLDGSSGDRDLAETAALVATLDLVITTDTSLRIWPGRWASRCGFCCRTWGTGAGCRSAETTPWYPTARLLRQKTPGDWAGLVERVAGRAGRDAVRS